MIRAKNERDLLDILRVISSEAVGLSKKMNESADPTLAKFMKQYEEDRKMYGNLDEQEEEAPESDDIASEEPSTEEPESEDPVTEEPPAEESESEEETGTMGASFDSVVQAVNNLRAGKSLRDSSIKQQAQNYYDKLSEPERTTLLVFLKALSDIIAGQVDGKDAQDPSDPPASINISTGEEELPEEEPPSEEPPAEEPSAEREMPSTPDSEEEEDTSPPIKVNESQDLTEIRKRVRRMMLRG